MCDNILYEQKKISKYYMAIGITTFAIQLFFLYFFSIVAQFDTDVMLKKYDTIVGLSSAITIGVLTIYGAILANRFIVSNFIGNNRARMYIYPEGRSQLYYRKTVAFISIFVFFVLIGGGIANIVYFTGEGIYPILKQERNILASILAITVSPVFISILTTTLIILSSIAGIRLSSTVATIVVGIVLVTSLSNVIAILFINLHYVMLLIIISTLLLTYVSIKRTGRRIENDEVFYK